jgi:TM2 domain-containing membrane protein YozV
VFLTNDAQTGYGNPMKSKAIAYILWFFTGVWGGHHFYLGRTGKWLLYLFTYGLCFFGWIYDFFTLGRQVGDENMRTDYRNGFSIHRIVISHDRANARPFNTAGFSAEKQILLLSSRNPVLTVRQIVAGTNLDADEAETTLAKLVERGIARLREALINLTLISVALGICSFHYANTTLK